MGLMLEASRGKGGMDSRDDPAGRLYKSVWLENSKIATPFMGAKSQA